MRKTLLHLPEQFALVAAALVRKVHDQPSQSQKKKRTLAAPNTEGSPPVLHDIAQIMDRRRSGKHPRRSGTIPLP
jgi:hypothetical protein